MKINLDIKNFIIKFVTNKFEYKYNFTYPNQKYSIDQIIDGLLLILKTGISYNEYEKINKIISGKTINRHLCFFRNNKIFEDIYKCLLEKYFKINKTKKLKYQLVDSTFIFNQYNVKNVGRNKFYKGKKGIKLSCLTDVNGIPISILIDKGNKNDAKFISDHLNKILIMPNTIKYKNHNRYKQYILADKGYSSNEVRQLFRLNGYIPIIPYNKRNTKDINKIKYLTNKEKQIYKKRIRIENLFSWLKKNKRIKELNEKSIESYLTFLYMSLIKILLKKI